MRNTHKKINSRLSAKHSLMETSVGKQHYKKHTSRERRNQEERRHAVKVAMSESPAQVALRTAAADDDVQKYVDAVKADRRDFFGVEKLDDVNADVIVVA